MIPAGLRHAVWQRAEGRCEYCLIHESDVLLPHEPDHIIAIQHGGPTALGNLALACFECNRLKGPNLASIDPKTSQIVPLFHPRSNCWKDHFRLEGANIVPLTPKARAKAELLRLNSDARVRDRESLARAGRFSL